MWLKFVVGIAAVAGVLCGGTGLTEARVAGPPAGLTRYGQVVWNLDALLHDTFGSRTVWEDFAGRGPIPNFSTTFIDPARSVPHVYTFATARHSAFRALRPAHPPRIGNSAAGSNIPFRIRGAYISCGNGTWLYRRIGQALPHGDMWCSKTPLAP